MDFQPLGARILIRLLTTDRTPGGLVVPEDARTSNSGVVEAIGKDVKEIKVGDHVVFSPLSSKFGAVEIEGKIRLTLHETEVLGILKDPAALTAKKSWFGNEN